ncbi:MAG: hypothetical protein V4692_10690 [Bdellovibrionota bacterium]
MASSPFETHWPKIKALAEAGKPEEIREFIAGFSEPKDRIGLFRFAARSLMFRDWENKDLGAIILLGDAGIKAALESGETDEANIICFNMSSNLADIWNDGFKRTREHFELGLQYAERAIDFRKRLMKGPGPFFMAYWAKGIHQYSLGHLPEARETFQQSLHCANEVAKASDRPDKIDPNAPYEVLLANGYIALVDIALGRPQGQVTFDQVMSACEGMKKISEDSKIEADICIEQLQYVRKHQSV